MIVSEQPTRRLWPTLARLVLLAGLMVALAVAASLVATSPAPAEGAAVQPPVNVPGFWDPRRRPERPDLSRINVIRFITEIDYPPFNFAAPDGSPQGFNVDLARLICEELKIACTVQMRRFETLMPSLNDNRGDAVIASIAPSADTRAKVDFTDPYYRTPGPLRGAARFVDRATSCPEQLEGKKVAVVAGTAHEAYLKALFTEAELRAYPNADAGARRRCAGARSICCSATPSRWRSGSTARIRRTAARFAAARIIESRYFGEGIGIAVRKRQRHDAPGAQLGAVPALGAGPLHRPVAALFPDQPVLSLKAQR